MWKLILGMIAVVCLDVGFAAYIRNSAPEDAALVTAKNAVSNENPVISASSISTQYSPGWDDFESTFPINGPVPTRRVEVPAVAVTHQRKPTVLLARSDNVVVKPKAPTIVPASDRYAVKVSKDGKLRQEYFGNMLVETRSTVARPALSRSPVPESRSFIAKALPVFKKPWDLMKAVGNKFR